MEDNDGSWGVMAVQFICTITHFFSLFHKIKNFFTLLSFRYSETAIAAVANYDDATTTTGRRIEILMGVSDSNSNKKQPCIYMGSLNWKYGK